MSELEWGALADRTYETGVDKAVLYIPDLVTGAYTNGVAWNGITGVTESPSGAEATPFYADNVKWLSLVSKEEFQATLEALMYPPEFSKFDGQPEVSPGVTVGQQNRGFFGLSYRSLIGDALIGNGRGYKLHLVYGATAAPSEKNRATVNDTPEPMAMSWEITTTPMPVGEVEGVEFNPTAHITINSVTADADDLATLEAMLYGTDGTPGTNPSLPSPAAVLAMFPSP